MSSQWLQDCHQLSSQLHTKTFKDELGKKDCFWAMQTKKAISIPCPFWSCSALSPLPLSLLFFAAVHFAAFRAYPYTIITYSPSTYHFLSPPSGLRTYLPRMIQITPSSFDAQYWASNKIGSYTSENKTAHSTMSERVSVASLVIGAIWLVIPPSLGNIGPRAVFLTPWSL